MKKTTKEETIRIVDKLIEWKNNESKLTDPENFCSSWISYDVYEKKNIISQLVDRGELPILFSRRKINDFGKTVTAFELLDGLTRCYASDKFKGGERK